MRTYYNEPTHVLAEILQNADDVGTSANRPSAPMNIDTAKIDEAVLALLYLGRHDGDRTWKSFDWDAMNRLHRKGTSPIR